MQIEHQIISKILDEHNFFVLNKYNIRSADFYVLGEAFDFIQEYTRANKDTPDYRTVVDLFEEFDYMPEVSDSFQYLCTTLKQQTAKRLLYNMLQKELPDKYSILNGTELKVWLRKEIDTVDVLTSINNCPGTNFATNGAERLGWYEESKDKRSNIFIPTPYPTLTELLAGGMECGDYILLNSFTNRGKSWLVSQMGLAGWRAGFGVLHYSPELSKKQQVNRLDTIQGHFNNIHLRNGELEDETRYREYLNTYNENNTVPYIVKTMGDLPNGLSLEQIEADLMRTPEVKMIIIDGFNLMVHKGRDGNRNNMTNTSRALRQLFGQYEVAGLVAHQTTLQAEKENNIKNEIGNRIVKPPALTAVSESSAMIQDACTVLSFDQINGCGLLEITKARQPVVGKQVALNCNFNVGFIEEAPESFNF